MIITVTKYIYMNQIGEDGLDKGVFLHELGHMVTTHGLDSKLYGLYIRTGEAVNKVEDVSGTSINVLDDFVDSKEGLYKNRLMEAVNDLFTKEYYEEYYEKFGGNQYSVGYYQYMSIVYALCEILPEDAIRQYQFNNNENYILNALLDIDDNMEMAYDFITSINSVERCEKTYGSAIDKNLEEVKKAQKSMSLDEFLEIEEVKTTRKKADENYKKIYNALSYFYEKKYGRSMNDDLVMLLYFYNIPNDKLFEYLDMEEVQQKVNNYFGIDGESSYIVSVKAKGYMSSHYKENHNSVEVLLSDGREIEINDSNRYITKSEVAVAKERRDEFQRINNEAKSLENEVQQTLDEQTEKMDRENE